MINLKELDRIELTINELFNLLKWRDNHKDLVHDYKQVIPEGIVDVKGGMTIYFKFINEQITSYESYVDEKLICKIKTERLGGQYRVLESYINKEMLRALQMIDISFNEIDLIADTCTTVSSIMAYLEHFRSEVIIREQPIKMSNTQRRRAMWHNKHNSSSRFIKLNRVIYRIPDGARYTNPDKPLRQRHTESWSVRGHQRHLKSGKVIWIKPYIKGKGAVKKPKTYKLGDGLLK